VGLSLVPEKMVAHTHHDNPGFVGVDNSGGRNEFRGAIYLRDILG
jgi:hypothetical protein